MSEPNYEYQVIDVDDRGAWSNVTSRHMGVDVCSEKRALDQFANVKPQEDHKVLLRRREVTDWEVIQEREIRSVDTITRRKVE